ncbi:hypothetical protein [Thiocapsa sp. UBA6158]|jgi:hypothetical protein|uniref:hypothetical protein n=1 Tax=Thiocapsa sp. UBA6158 TaxID=1947692 RepID=UPI0025DD80AA|nr:hypothetical protein [Thiocapsa sp. UBA6158]
MTVDDLRVRYPRWFEDSSECEIVVEMSRMIGVDQQRVARSLGLDAREYRAPVDCRPAPVQMATDPVVWAFAAALVAVVVFYRKHKRSIVSANRTITEEVKSRPLYKKIVGVGGAVFLAACLFPPIEQVWRSGSVKHSGFEFLFSLGDLRFSTSASYRIAWSVLAVALVAIVVVTAVLAYVLKKD